jgi:hypothetical protein
MQFDFGFGLVNAHRHPNGGGWVADSAIVAESAYVGPDATVFGLARVYGNARILGNSQVYGDAEVYGSASVYGYSVIRLRAWICGNAIVCNALVESGNAGADRFVLGNETHGVQLATVTPYKFSFKSQEYSVRY